MLNDVFLLSWQRTNSLSEYHFANDAKYFSVFSEAVAQRCSVKKVFLEISQNS